MQQLKAEKHMTEKEKRMIHNRNQGIREIMDEWKSWEHLILDDLKRIDQRIQNFYAASSLFGLKAKDREDFMTSRLQQLIKESVR
jgi:hypothetical protein